MRTMKQLFDLTGKTVLVAGCLCMQSTEALKGQIFTADGGVSEVC